MRRLSPTQLGQILFTATRGISKSDEKKVITAFVTYLARIRMTKKIAQVIAAYEKKKQEHEGKVILTVTTARPLTASVQRTLEEAFGTGAMVTTKEDAAIIGGVVVQTDTMRYDASLRGQLHALRRQLI